MSTTDAPTADASTAPRRPMRADARRNYDRLLTAAKAAFTEYGADASLEDIARRAGVGIGTLYRHFPTRQALLEATFRDLLGALHDRGHALLAAPSAGDALIDWLHALLDYVSRYRGLSELVMITMRDPGSDLYASCTGMRETGAQLLARGQHAGTIRQDIEGPDLIMMVNGIAWAGQLAHGGGRTDQLLDVMIAGLRSSPVDSGIHPTDQIHAGIEIDAGIAVSPDGRIDAGIGADPDGRIDAGIEADPDGRIDAGVRAGPDGGIDAGIEIKPAGRILTGGGTAQLAGPPN